MRDTCTGVIPCRIVADAAECRRPCTVIETSASAAAGLNTRAERLSLAGVGVDVSLDNVVDGVLSALRMWRGAVVRWEQAQAVRQWVAAALDRGLMVDSRGRLWSCRRRGCAAVHICARPRHERLTPRRQRHGTRRRIAGRGLHPRGWQAARHTRRCGGGGAASTSTSGQRHVVWLTSTGSAKRHEWRSVAAQ